MYEVSIYCGGTPIAVYNIGKLSELEKVISEYDNVIVDVVDTNMKRYVLTVEIRKPELKILHESLTENERKEINKALN